MFDWADASEMNSMSVYTHEESVCVEAGSLYNLAHLLDSDAFVVAVQEDTCRR